MPFIRTGALGRWPTTLAIAAALFAAAASSAPTAHAHGGSTLAVDPVSGNDANPGTPAAPLKTLFSALGRAHAGDTIRLGPARYPSATNGERYNNSLSDTAVVVPGGVTIQGTTTGAAETVLVGSGGRRDDTAFLVHGPRTIRDVLLEDFGTGIRQTRGTGSFRNVRLHAVRNGMQLVGTARATYTGSIEVADDNLGAFGAALAGSARLAMLAGSVKLVAGDGEPLGCRNSNVAFHVLRHAALTLRPGVTVEGFAGTSVRLSDAGRATLEGVDVTARALEPGCAAEPAIAVLDHAKLVGDRLRLTR